MFQLTVNSYQLTKIQFFNLLLKTHYVLKGNKGNSFFVFLFVTFYHFKELQNNTLLYR